jgi:hypothetical protein
MDCNSARRRGLVACAVTVALAPATTGSAAADVLSGTLPISAPAPTCLLPDGTPVPALSTGGCPSTAVVTGPGSITSTLPVVGGTIPTTGTTGTSTTTGTGTAGDGHGSAAGQPDTRGPRARLAARRARLALSLRRGYTVTVACDEACAIDGGLSKAGRWSAIARGSARLNGRGKTKLTLRFTGKARRALARSRSVKLTIRVTATDAAGNVTTTRRSVTLKR